MEFHVLLFLALWNLQSSDAAADLPTDKQFIIVEANATWNQAKTYCHDQVGGTLLRLDSQHKLVLLKKLDNDPPWDKALKNGEYWIGLHNREVENCSDVHHFWEGGCEPLGWTDWKSGSPANCVKDRCVVMKDLKWFSANCSHSYSFVCEKETSCPYTEHVNITLEDVSRTDLTYEVETTFSNCRDLCYGLSFRNKVGCSILQESGACLFLFVDSGNHEHRLEDSYNGTSYHVRNCSQATFELMPQSAEESVRPDDVPSTTCAQVLGDDYFEYLADYRVALIPSQYQKMDILGDEEKCKKVCLQAELDRRKCWAVNMFSELSNFCRLYYLNGEPPYLFYQRYVSNTPGPLLLRRRLSRHRIEDDDIVDNIEELIVNPKNTTLFNLRFISVYENKPAKIGMGVIGAVFIATVVIALIVVDCPLIFKHVRTIAARNIRKRNRCKKKKTTKKLSSNKVGHFPATEAKGSTVPDKGSGTTPSKKATYNNGTTPTAWASESTESEAHSSKQSDLV